MIANGKIQFIGPEESAEIPPGAQRMGRSGYTVIPGLVGMHDHLYYTDSYTVQVSTERLASRDCSLRRSLTRRRDSIWRLA